MLLRLRLYFRILKSKVLPTMSSRLRMGRRSACEPGRKASTPMSTENPPLTRLVIVPLIVPSSSWLFLMFSQTLMLAAFSLDRMTRSSSSSHHSTMTSIRSPTFAVMEPSSPRNSLMRTCPSDLYPMSTRTRSLSTAVMTPETTSPSLNCPKFSSYSFMDSPKSALSIVSSASAASLGFSFSVLVVMLTIRLSCPPWTWNE